MHLPLRAGVSGRAFTFTISRAYAFGARLEASKASR
jgi:hypothetical protein